MGEESRTPAVLAILRVTIAAFFLVVFALQICAAMGYNFSGRILLDACLILFAVLGNYSAALRPNYFVGIRTPWTLENADTWRATHRLGGRLMFFGAIALLLLQFMISEAACLIVFLVAVGSLVLWSIWYSWHHFHAHESEAR